MKNTIKLALLIVFHFGALTANQTNTDLRAFIESPSIPIDDKLFLHVLGDRFGKDTGLEGISPTSTLQYRLTLLEAKLAHLSDHGQNRQVLEKLVHTLKDALITYQMFRGPNEALKDYLHNKLSTLKQGETFLWPGGWTKHTLYFEIIKQTKEHLTFRIYNTGEGLEFHPMGFLGTQKVFLPYLERIDVPTDQFLHPTLLTALKELTDSNGAKTGPADLYQNILHHLGGKPSVESQNEANLLLPQQSGTCSYRSLAQALNGQIADKRLAERMEWESAFKALVDFFQLHHTRLLTFEELPRRLFQKALSVFAELSKQLYDNRSLNDQEFHYTAQWIQSFTRQLTDIETDIKAQLAQNALHALIKPIFSRERFSKLSLPVVMNLTNNSKPNLPKDYEPVEGSRFHPEAKTLVSELKQVVFMADRANSSGQALQVIEALAELIQRIPLPLDRFWKSFDASQAEGLLDTLLSLSREHVRALILGNHQEKRRAFQLRPKNFIVQVKLLTLADFLVHRYKEVLKIELPTLYQSSFDTLLFDGSPYFHLTDPIWTEQLRGIGAYWESVHARGTVKLSLFGVERHPATDSYFGRHHWETDSDRKKGHGYFDSDLEWPDVAWAKQWVERPETKALIERRFPKLAQTTPIYRALFALSDSFSDSKLGLSFTSNRNLIPRAFFVARDLSLYTNYLLQGSLNSEVCWSPNAHHFLIETERVVSDVDYLRTRLRLKTIFIPTAWVLTAEEGATTAKSELALHSPHILDIQTHFKMTSDQIDNEDLWSIYTANTRLDILSLMKDKNRLPNRHRLPLNQISQLAPPAWDLSTDTSLEDMHERLGLSSVKELQIQETLGYFIRHESLLRQRDYRTFFKWMLFEPGLLSQELSREPRASAQLVDRLLAFFRKNITLYGDVGDFEILNFFLEMSFLVERAVSFHQTHYPNDFPIGYQPDYIDTRTLIRQLLDQLLSTEEKALFYRTLALTYSSGELEADGLIELLKAVIFTNLQGNKIKGREEEQVFRDLLRMHRLKIEKLIKSPEKERILNAVYQFFFPHNARPQWQESRFPYVTGVRGESTVYFHLLDGDLYDNGILMTLPPSITQDPSFQQTVGARESYLGSMLSLDSYELDSNRGEKIRIRKTSSGDLAFQKRIQGSWYQWADTSLLSALHPSLLLGHSHWFNDAEMRIYRDSDGLPVARVVLNRTSQGHEIGAIFQLDPKERDTGLELLPVQKTTPFGFFHSFEDLGFVRVWAEIRDGMPKIVELPRFGLLFDSDRVLLSRQFAGYHVAAKQHVAPLGDYRHYLLLESPEGRNLVLIPRQALEKPDNSGSLVTSTMPMRQLDQNKPQRYLVYRYNQKTEQLDAETEEGRFYLALLGLWEQKYPWANQLLRGDGLPIRPLTTEECEVLQWIAEPKSQDHDPIALALRLQASSQLLRHFRNLDQPPTLNLTQLARDYQRYLQILPTLGQGWLDEEEETLIISAFKNLSSRDTLVNQQQLDYRMKEFSIPIPETAQQAKASRIRFTGAFGGEILDLKSPKELVAELFQTYSQGSPPSHILRPTLANVFIEAYQVAREESTDAATRSVLRKIAGIELPAHATKAELTHTFKKTLQMMMLATPKEKATDRTIAFYLSSVMKQPSRYPTTAEAKTLLEKKSTTAASQLKMTWKDQSTSQRIWSEALDIHTPCSSSKEDAPTYQQCLRQQEELWHTEPSLKPFEKYLNRQAGTVSKPDATVSSLFVLKKGDSMIQQKLRDKQTQLLSFWQQASPDTYQIPDLKMFDQAIQSDLLPKIKTLESHLADQQNELLWLANQHSTDPITNAYEKVSAVAEQQEPLTLDDVIHLFFKRDLERYHEANPALSSDTIRVLSERTMSYLIDAIALKQWESIAKLAQAIKTEASAKERHLLIQELAHALLAKRTYSYLEHPEYLVFEYYKSLQLNKGFILKPEQVTSLDRLQIEKGTIKNPDGLGAVLELIMASGKTAVLLPLLSILHAQAGELTLCIMPEKLMPSKLDELKTPLGRTFRQAIEVIEINRQMSLKQDELSTLLHRLEIAQAKGRLVMMTNSSLQSLYLHFITRLHELAHSGVTQELAEESELLRQILRLMKEQGTVILDEVDAVLDVLKSHHFTTGDVHGALEPVIVDAVFAFYEAVVKRPGGERKQLVNALTKDPSAQQYLLSDLGKPATDTLAVWHEELHQVYPLTSSKKLYTHYGPDPTTFTAIPYHLGDPVLRSQFGTDLEILNYTIQMYLESGITEAILRLEIDRLQALAPRELAEERLFSIIREKKMSLKRLQAHDRIELLKWVNQEQQLKLELIKRHVIPQIKVYPTQLNSNAQLYKQLFKRVLGFSGTLWNSRTFPNIFKEPSASNTQPLTLKAIWKPHPSPSRTLVSSDDRNRLQSLVQQIYAPRDRTLPKGSFIDIAGVFRGINNRDVAQAILELPIWQGTEILGVVFYQDDAVMILSIENGQAKITPFAESRLNKEALIAFWDQQHTVGSDIDLSSSMTAAVSIGQHTVMRDFLQGIWRLRKLDRGQTIHFVVHEEDRKWISDTLQQAFGETSSPLTLRDILRYVEYNEARRLGDHQFRAFRNKLEAIFTRDIYQQLLDPALSIQKVLELYAKTDMLFSSSRQVVPKLHYGQPKQLLKRDEAIQQVRNQLDKTLSSVKQLLITDCKQQVEALITAETPYLNDWIPLTTQYEQELTVETDSEQGKSREQDKQEEQKKQANKNPIKRQYQPQPVIRWEYPGFKQEALKPQPAQEIAKLVVKKNGLQMSRPLLSTPEALEQSGVKTQIARLFDPNLLISLNLMPIYQMPEAIPFSPFGIYQKSISHALVIRHKVSGQLQLLMLDTEEARDFEQWLTEDSKRPAAEPRSIQMALYHLDMGIYRQSSDPIDAANLETDPAFVRLKTQAKFFRGDSYYSETELPILKDWLDNSGVDKKIIHHFFRTTVLKWKQTRIQEFTTSPLERLLLRK